MMKARKSLFVGWLFLLLFCSCSTGRQALEKQFNLQGNCAPTTPRNYVWSTPDLQPTLTEEELLRFSKKSWQMASLLNVTQALREMMELEKKSKLHMHMTDRVHWLELKQQVIDKINLASLEISATAAELDCEEERTNQLRGLLQERMGKAEKRITVAAILTGAMTGLLVGALNLSNSHANLSEEIGIAGGVAEATLGFLSLKIKRDHVFNHQKNHLRDVWTGPDSTSNFPPVIWYYLNLPFDKGKPSLRASLKKQWIALDQFSLTDSHHIKLYFNEGGIYDADDLGNRSSMLDQLEAIVSLMKKDLQLITKELIEGKTKDKTYSFLIAPISYPKQKACDTKVINFTRMAEIIHLRRL